MDNETFEELKKDFSWVKDDERILAVLLFGSKVSENDHFKSDVDIAIVVPGSSNFYYDCEGVSDEKVDSSKVLGKVFREVNTASKDYDVHVFEELPLHVQIDIINEHQVVYTSDKYAMYEYFYNYRQLWKDQKYRNMMSKEEIISTL
ncbi:MAG: DNA polymerase subunit beta [Candidatus Thermoplasmatota archaeon]|nr:DNA polymerase subunit beta [Candidatus Thermoplasmatota archaeon]MBS3790447.1 DNA polymerase subunit beta [Candidatus Thermoplasmatota archaeon]